MRAPEFRAGDLVYYGAPSREPYLGLILCPDGPLMRIYRFKFRDVVQVISTYCDFFSKEDCDTMCDKDWWRGLIVRTCDGTIAEVLDGRFVSDEMYELLLKSSALKIKSVWMQFDQLRLIGHTFIELKPWTMGDLALVGHTRLID